MSFNLKSRLHKIEFSAVVLLILILLGVWLINRKLPIKENELYSMQSHVYWSGDTGVTSEPNVENVETLRFHGRAFSYTSSWYTPEKLYYLNTYGKIYPVIGNLAYVKIEGKTVSDGFDEYLGGLKVWELFSRRLDLNVGQSSYVRFLKLDKSGFCGYYYSSDSVYCFAPETTTVGIPQH